MMPALDDGDVRIWLGDAIAGLRAMPDGLAQTCVTSPPYWGLRDYGAEGQIGLEDSPDAFVARLVEVFREVRRVLRDDGTLWLNLGDSYAAARGGSYQPAETLAGGVSGRTADGSRTNRGRGDGYQPSRNAGAFGLKHKDLVGIPWRVAFALQADGWYLRSDIIWHKPNPMPESVTDRPTKSHEYVFLLSKSARYFYDAEAIRETDSGRQSGNIKRKTADGAIGHRPADHLGSSVPWESDGTGRNARSVWTITTKPYAEAHFATFPNELPERCIRAGTSDEGACSACGAPRERVMTGIAPDGREAEIRGRTTRDSDGRPLVGDNMIDRGTRGSFSASRGVLKRRTDGWRSTCACGAETIPQIVLDPFMGSGTTAWVARHLGRHAVGCELNAEYLDIAARRLQQQSLLA
jgi:DNA modification methylase